MDKPRLRLKWWLPVVLVLLVFPASAHAHTTIKGAGDIINGLVHPLMTPAHVLIILGLGLWIGQQVPLNLKTPMLVFIPLSAVALVLTTTGVIKYVYPPFLTGIALCAGAVVALEKRLSRMACGALFALAAIGIGLDSAVESGATSAVIKTLAGTWISLIVLICDIAIYVSLCTKKQWQRIGVRVLGSWIIAISLLVLAFSFRK